MIFIVMYLKTPLRRNSMVGKHPALFSGAHISIIFDKTGPTDDSNFIHEESKSKIKIYKVHLTFYKLMLKLFSNWFQNTMIVTFL